MSRQYRFRSLFIRQWLNSIGIPFVGAMLLLILYPSFVTLTFLILVAAAFLVIAYFGRTKELRERSVALMLASFGIGMALVFFSSATRSVENARGYLGKETEAVGYVTRWEEGSFDLSLTSMNGKLSMKKIRLESKESLSIGSKVGVAFLPTDAEEEDALHDGIFLSGELVWWESIGKSFVISAIGSLRTTLCEKLGEEREGAFLKAILLGDRSDLAEEDEAAFRKTASLHILAISGLHITVLVGISYCMMNFLYMPDPWKKAVLIPLVIFLYLVTGGAISVFRACFMTLFGMIAFFLKQISDSLTPMVFAASVILMQNPFAVTDLSFLFTFISTFAIITLASPLCTAIADKVEPYFYKKGRSRVYSVLSYVLSGLLISSAVFLFSLPLNLLVFGEVQVFSPLYSAILIPFFAPCLFISVIFLVFLLLPFAAPFVSEAVYFVIRLFLNLIRILSDSAPRMASFGAYNIPIALGLVAVLCIFMGFRLKYRSFLFLYVFLTAAMLPMILFS